MSKVVKRVYKVGGVLGIKARFRADGMAFTAVYIGTKGRQWVYCRITTRGPKIGLKLRDNARETKPVWFMLDSELHSHSRDAIRLAHFMAMMFLRNDSINKDPSFATELDRISNDFKPLMYELFEHAQNTCDEVARKKAKAFHPNDRFDVYCLLLRDDTGRLSQMAKSHPGVILFTLVLGRLTDPGQVSKEKAIANIEKGLRLKDIISEMLNDWHCSIDHMLPALELRWGAAEIITRFIRACTDDFKALGKTTFSRFLRASTGELAQVFHTQAILIRNAGALVDSSYLLLPTFVKVIPSDIPKDPIENARWYTAMLGHGEFKHPAKEALEQMIQDGLSALVSRSFNELAHLRESEIERAISEAFDYLKETEAIPNRSSNLARILKRSNEWHVRMAEVQTLSELRKYLGPEGERITDLTQVKFKVDVGRFKGTDLEVTPISTPLDLIREGNHMRHCVASRVKFAIDGSRAYASAIVKGHRLTVELLVSNAKPTSESLNKVELGEVRGLANQIPSPEELTILRDWVQRMNDDRPKTGS